MERKNWIRGLAVSLSVMGVGQFSYAQNYAAPGNGLAPSSFPALQLPAYPSQYLPKPPTIVGNGYPYVAQNATQPAPSLENQQYPVGSYTAADSQSNLIPSIGGDQFSAQPSLTDPLPPVDISMPPQNHQGSSPTSTAPLYQVPTQYSPAPEPVPMAPPQAQEASKAMSNASTPVPSNSLIDNSVWSGYSASTACGANCATGCATGIVAPKPWIFGASGLIFDRIDHDYTRLSSNFQNSGPSVLNTYDAESDLLGGFEIFGGRYFGCGRCALIASYWGLFPTDETTLVYDPERDPSTAPTGDYLISDLPFTVAGPAGGNIHGIEMQGGNNFYDIYARAYAHRLIRSQDYNNVEVNLFSFGLGGAIRHGVASDCNACCGPSVGCSGPCSPMTGAQCSPFRFAWLGGFRYFQFNDYIDYGASRNNATFGEADDYYYRNTLQNNLFGGQIGGRLTYCMGRCFNVYAGSKFGVFGNQMNYDTFAGSTTTAAVVTSSNSYNGQSFDLSTSACELATLGEGELGMGFGISSCWTANVGYRIIGISGVATAPGQIPQDFSLLNDVQQIRHNDSLILHGVSLGAMYNW